MGGLLTAEFWVRLVGIAFLNLILSGDNALVIALAVRRLPGRARLLGQVWGALGAVALRLVFVTAVSLMLRVPLLQLAGGVLLAWIAVRLVRPGGEAEGDVRRGGSASLWEAVWIVIVADVTMSLDNVLAIAAAAHGDLVLVAVGVGLSLPLVVWGAGALAYLMNRHAWIVWLGGGLLGYVAGEMTVEDRLLRAWFGDAGDLLRQGVPLAVGALIAALGWWLARRQHGPRARVPERL
jgi:YjbE family integral membrane protein